MSSVLTTPETYSETTTVLSSETRPAPRASLRKRRRASQPRWDIWLILVGTLLVSAFCVGMFLRQERYRVATTPIAEMQLGANVPGVNPGEADDLSLGESIDPATWRKVSLTGRQTDGSLLEIELLRPLAWVDAHRIDGSDRLLLHMGELDFHGEAQLTAIDPCPPVRAGPGRTVTGLFRHHAHDVLDLYTTDGATLSSDTGRQRDASVS